MEPYTILPPRNPKSSKSQGERGARMRESSPARRQSGHPAACPICPFLCWQVMSRGSQLPQRGHGRRCPELPPPSFPGLIYYKDKLLRPHLHPFCCHHHHFLLISPLERKDSCSTTLTNHPPPHLFFLSDFCLLHTELLKIMYVFFFFFVVRRQARVRWGQFHFR